MLLVAGQIVLDQSQPDVHKCSALVVKYCVDVNAMQGFADKVFGAAYNITTDADLALGIFDDLVVILNVDVNVTGMNNDIAVSPCVFILHFLHALAYRYISGFIIMS